jgi:hypothetical protein
VWARLAAFFSFLAVLSALLAPISLLAEEVRTGKLGGLCSASMASSGSPESGPGDAPSASHCNWCSSTALALPPQPICAIPYSPDFQLVSVDVSSTRAASLPGLPFSRGPPAL